MRIFLLPKYQLIRIRQYIFIILTATIFFFDTNKNNHCLKYDILPVHPIVKPITNAILKGLFNRSIDGINMVNAPFIAKERGVEVQESRSNEVHEYTSTVQVQVTTQNRTHRVTGSIFGKGDSRIVQFDEYKLEAVLSKNMLDASSASLSSQNSISDLLLFPSLIFLSKLFL